MSQGTNIAHMGKKILYNKEHWEIHERESFTAFTVNESMGDGDKINIGFKTPAVGQIHMVADFTSKTAAHMTIFEGATWSGGESSGVALPIYNRYRIKPKDSALLTNINEVGFSASGALNSDLTGLGGGTALKQKWAYAANIGTPAPQRGKHEWVLQTGTLYAIEVEADAVTSAAQLELNWYEEGV